MTLFKMYYEGVVDAETKNEAEVHIAQNRDELIHKKTEEIKEEADYQSIEDNFDLLWNVMLSEEKYDNIDPDTAMCIYKDYSSNTYIFQFTLKNTDERFGLLLYSEEKRQNAQNMQIVEEDIQFVEASKQTAPLVLGSWMKK